MSGLEAGLRFDATSTHVHWWSAVMIALLIDRASANDTDRVFLFSSFIQQ
jgi:hypothetical protein